MSFFENFILLCNERGEMPTVVAKSVGVDKSAPSRWAKGELPKNTNLMKVADYFGVSVEELLSEGKPPRRADAGVKAAPKADDDGLAAALDALRNQPGRRALLSATKNMTEAQVLRMADWIADLTGGNKD